MIKGKVLPEKIHIFHLTCNLIDLLQSFGDMPTVMISALFRI